MAIDPGLRRLILPTLLPAFPGLTAPQWAVDLVAEGLGGYVVFYYNIADTGQLRALTGSLREVRPDVLLSLDEEGGDVTRLGHLTGSPYPGNAALGAIDDLGLTERIYRAIGADLRATGFNLDLAPTVDVNTADDNPIIGTRSFGTDPARVSAHAAAAIAGLQSAGVAACAKHFPGHGATHTDSHLEMPTVDVPMGLLRERDLAPFAAAIEAGARSIMTAHIRVPVLTGDLPATFSRPALVDLLRGELGFTGVIVSDALDMRGAAGIAGSTAKAAPRALAAGVDLLCLAGQCDQDLVEETIAEITVAVDAGWLPVARIEEAAGRVADLSAWSIAAARAEDAADDGIGYPAAQRAVRVEGSLIGLDSPLVVQMVDAELNIAAGRVPWGLGPHINGTQQLQVAIQSASPEQVRALAGTRPIVVVGRNLHRQPAAAALIEALAPTNPVVAVEMGWPSAWRPAGVRAFVTTFGASRANGWAAASALGLTG
ncbi:glycoside hydrolase family 3 protein [Rugosimonospora africana]|uniref:Sugar hydrolase n=1 Tax=Rugosimonospora africana TaxID=556532 RepID=A0A8J3VPP2_9ACTN|nr:glycoside hydrolase family 3 protein [Rugosimonospora africana]GIH13513.1 sugar hydrolase [Rugosimonospora africana]